MCCILKSFVFMVEEWIWASRILRSINRTRAHPHAAHSHSDTHVKERADSVRASILPDHDSHDQATPRPESSCVFNLTSPLMIPQTLWDTGFAPMVMPINPGNSSSTFEEGPPTRSPWTDLAASESSILESGMSKAVIHCYFN